MTLSPVQRVWKKMRVRSLKLGLSRSIRRNMARYAAEQVMAGIGKENAARERARVIAANRTAQEV